MKSNNIFRILIGAALFGLIYSLLYHVLVIDFEEFDVVRNLQDGKGTISFRLPDKQDQFYLKFRTSDKYKPEEIEIYINDVLVTGLESDTDPGYLNFKGLLSVEMTKPGVNWVKVLKNKSEEGASADDRVTLKNSRKKGVQDNLFIMFKASPLIPKNIVTIVQLSLWGWLFGTVLMCLAIVLSLQLLSIGKTISAEKLLSVDLTTYIAPAVVLFGLYVSSWFSKYYLVITGEFFWFIVIFFCLISKAVIYLSTAFRREFASGFVLTMKKAIKNPINTMIVIGLILILMIPLPSLIYPYFPIRDAAQVAEHDAEIFANIAYVLLLIGAVCKFVQDYRRIKKEAKEAASKQQ